MMTTAPHGLGVPPPMPVIATMHSAPSTERLEEWAWWFCSGCRRPIARYTCLSGGIQIRCRSCKTMNTLVMRGPI